MKLSAPSRFFFFFIWVLDVSGFLLFLSLVGIFMVKHTEKNAFRILSKPAFSKLLVLPPISKYAF
jgi:hypothetical protein